MKRSHASEAKINVSANVFGIPFGFLHCDTKSCADKYLDLLLMTPTTHLIPTYSEHLPMVHLE